MLYNIIQIATSLSSLALAIFIFWYNPKSQTNRSFAYFLLSISAWITTLFLFYNADQENILNMGRLNFVATEATAYFGFLFGYHFPSKRFDLSKIIKDSLNIWFLFIIPITLFTDLVDRNEVVINNEIITHFGPFYFVFMIPFIILISALIYFPVLKYKHSSINEKQQIKYFTLGSSLALFFAVFVDMILPAIFGIYSFQQIGPLSFLFLFGFTTYAIVKHNLMDIRIVIQRSILYFTLLSLVVGLYLLIAFVMGYVFHRTTNSTYLISACIATITGIFGVTPIKNYFTKITDKFFYKNKYNYSEAIEDLSKILNKNIRSEEIISKSIAKIKAYIKPDFIYFYLVEKNKIYNGENSQEPREKISEKLLKGVESSTYEILKSSDIDYLLNQDQNFKPTISALHNAKTFYQKYQIELYVSLKTDNKLVGIMGIGKKLSGDEYSNDDIRLLKTFSYQAAVALEKAKYYEKVKNYSQDLEKQVEERTREIKTLQEEQKQMMVDVSHNLQTPLTIMKAELSLLEQQLPKNKNVQMFDKSIDKLSKFIYDMLILSRLETGKIVLDVSEFSLSELLFELAEYYEVVLNDKNIKMIKNIEKDIVVKADRHKVEEIMNNLASNAMKYIGKGDTIILELKKGKKYAEISVTDNGIGIEKKHLENIFKRFYRIEDKQNENVKGTGLGLAFCKKIVEMHNGKIAVESTLDKGSKFTIYLPL